MERERMNKQKERRGRRYEKVLEAHRGLGYVHEKLVSYK
jgi:hypothetical protein